MKTSVMTDEKGSKEITESQNTPAKPSYFKQQATFGKLDDLSSKFLNSDETENEGTKKMISS